MQYWKRRKVKKFLASEKLAEAIAIDFNLMHIGEDIAGCNYIETHLTVQLNRE